MISVLTGIYNFLIPVLEFLYHLPDDMISYKFTGHSILTDLIY
jgi:hypothetical protein